MKTSQFLILSSVTLLLSAGGAVAQNAPKPAGDAPEAAEPRKLPDEAPKMAPTKPGAPGAPGAGGAMRPKADPDGAMRPKAEPNGAMRPKADPNAEPKPKGEQGAKPDAGQQPPAAQKPGEAEPKAEGQKPGEAKPARAARPAPKLTPQVQGQVRERFRTLSVRPVHVDFAVRIGVAVPRTVVLAPLPPEIITIVPDYEGYEFFEVPGQIIIVDPESQAIVAVLPL